MEPKEGPVAKAYFIGESTGDQSNALVQQETTALKFFGEAGAIAPLYDPNRLAEIFESSSTLRQCVDAYIVNIDSYGHTLEPTIDLESSEADELIRDALRIERAQNVQAGKISNVEDLIREEPSNAEVKTRRQQLEIEIRQERARLENFFENCTTDIPFSGPEGLRGLTRQDIEVIGQGYWEVLRNGLGEVRRFNRLEARTMRLLPVDPKPVEVKIPRRISALKSEQETVRKTFRGLVQLQDGSNKIVYFKEFDDPRFMDSETGEAFATLEEATKARTTSGREGPVRPATEVLTFKLTSPRGVYGVPRWMGAIIAVRANREAEEMNFLYFENRSVPPLAIIVTGGRLQSGVVDKLQDYITNNIKGLRNSHKIMILEGEPAPGVDGQNNGKMRIELRPLTEAQQKEGTFQEFDKRNSEKIGQVFRLPRMLRGDVQDQNRSTAEASVDFAEGQVFGPIRSGFDWTMNRTVLPELGIQYHKFVSNGPVIKDPAGLADMVNKAVASNVLVPGEGREIMEDVFHREFVKINEPWARQPIGVTVAGHNSELSGGGGSPGAGGGPLSQPGAGATQAAAGVDQTKALAKSLEDIHAKLVKQEIEEGIEHFMVPADVMATFVKPYSK